MKPYIETRVIRGLQCGLYTPSEVFEANLGLVNLEEFKQILFKQEVHQTVEGIAKLQEQVFILRGKMREIYKFEEGDKEIVDIPAELQKVTAKFTERSLKILEAYDLSFTLWHVTHKFAEWQTKEGMEEIRRYAGAIYKKYKEN